MKRLIFILLLLPILAFGKPIDDTIKKIHKLELVIEKSKQEIKEAENKLIFQVGDVGLKIMACDSAVYLEFMGIKVADYRVGDATIYSFDTYPPMFATIYTEKKEKVLTMNREELQELFDWLKQLGVVK